MSVNDLSMLSMPGEEYKMQINKIYQGDCIEVLKTFPDDYFDSVVTDPPYGLEFMGKGWDKFGAEIVDFKEGEKGGLGGYSTHVRFNKGLKSMLSFQQFCNNWAKECLRVLKPGGFLLSFAGTRTYHRMACGVEDAGFEIRDMISWLYGSGFPKSHNIGKAIDKIQNNEREIVGISNNHISENNQNVTGNITYHSYGNNKDISKGQSDWEGWGTALKPACEPIVVARKPLSEKNVALNVLKHGTAGINIDGCRIEYDMSDKNPATNPLYRMENNYKNNHNPDIGSSNYQIRNKVYKAKCSPQGRFPANIILDEEAGKLLDEQRGISKSKKQEVSNKGSIWGSTNENKEIRGHNDKGGASRFFYCAKASKSERNLGCEELEEKDNLQGLDTRGRTLIKEDGSKSLVERWGKTPTKNNHPTVKPIKLMQYLVRLVTRKGGITLDPFMGSGTTAIAALKENINFVGIEREDEYIKIAEARIKPFLNQPKQTTLREEQK